MAANKVIVNNQTILDLTADTVTAATLKKGVTAHDASGTQITGTMEEASTSETWVLKAELAIPDDHVSYPVDATMYSNDYQRDVNVVQIDMASEHLTFFVLNDDNNRDSVNGYAYGEWYDNSYRKLVFNVPPTGNLLEWLESNGVKQASDTAVQPEKAVSITANGTTEVTPDAPYDAMAKTTVTVDVAATAAEKETWVLNNKVDDTVVSFDCNFSSNGESFSGLSVAKAFGNIYKLAYGSKEVAVSEYNDYSERVWGWANIAYRKLVFTTPPTGNLLTWLQANGVKQDANLAVQPSKDVTVTSNGTTEITPDAPYDVMEKANVTVNVRGDVEWVTPTSQGPGD